MNKRSTVTIAAEFSDYTITLESNGITFDNRYNRVWFPIEVFYQMWNGDELMNYMEQYHESRKESK